MGATKENYARETRQKLSCAECGDSFLSTRIGHRLCSTACRKRKSKRNRSYIPKESICKQCNRRFAEKQEWDVFCSEKCRKSWTSSGIIRRCQVCGKDFPITGYTHQKYCSDECRKLRYPKLAFSHKAENKSKGLCSNCSNPIVKGSGYLCEDHWFDKAARSNGFLRDRNRGKLVKSILEKQNYTCPYTGKKLVIGTNASIDHKNPRLRFPEQYSLIENIEWVDTFVNNSKNTMTKEEFIVLCKLIASRF